MTTAIDPKDLRLKVNGIEIDDIKLRRKLVNGSPSGPWEVVIKDPKIGTFSIDDSFILELFYNQSWKKTDVNSLIKLLI